MSIMKALVIIRSRRPISTRGVPDEGLRVLFFDKVGGMRLGGITLMAGLTITLALAPCVPASAARQKTRPPARAKKGTQARTKAEPPPVSEAARLRAQLVQA